MFLPSETYEPGSIQPVGFEHDVSPEHWVASEALVRSVLEAVTSASRGCDPLEIRFSHYQLDPLLSPALFGFSVTLFDADGNWTNEVAPGRDFRYALIVNLPVNLQAEVVLTVILELVYRNVTVKVMLETGQALEVDRVTNKTDELAKADVAEMLRYGWQEASRQVGKRAKDSGISLVAEYIADPFLSREELILRAPKLKEVYNELEPVRLMVDKFVGLTSGADWMLAGGTAEAASIVLKNLRASDMQKMMSQADRDSLVLGNGYFVTNLVGRGEVYCLRPEEVVIEDGQFYKIDENGRSRVEGHVLHLKGVEARALPYGLSLLEPFVADLVRRRIMSDASEFGRQLKTADAIPPSMRLWAEQTVELAARMEADQTATLAKRISPVVDLYDAKAGLYLPGQEMMH